MKCLISRKQESTDATARHNIHVMCHGGNRRTDRLHVADINVIGEAKVYNNTTGSCNEEKRIVDGNHSREQPDN